MSDECVLSIIENYQQHQSCLDKERVKTCLSLNTNLKYIEQTTSRSHTLLFFSINESQI